MADAPPGWHGILDDGERILWQGRPGTRVRWTGRQISASVFGIFFAGFALVWMVLASQAGGGFWMFGLIHFSIGLLMAVAPPFWSAWRRRHTWYTLTDRRAFVATDIPLQGRKLQGYPINRETRLEFEAGKRASVYFAKEYKRTKNGGYDKPVGFERIDDAETVYRLMRQVQSARGAA